MIMAALHGLSAFSHLSLSLLLACLLIFRRKPASDNDRAANKRRLRHYNLALLTSWGLATFHLLLSAYSYFLYRHAWWSPDGSVAVQLDAGARAAAWVLLSVYLQFEFGRRSDERFPAPLRVWWALFLLLSAFALAVHLTRSLHGLPVAAHLWALDSVSFLASIVLLFAGFLGKEGGGSPSEEPLLNGANDAAGRNANASIFTDAGFLSILTFSWMRPLLAVGYKKTLGLDDVPALDDRDRVRAVLPLFKNNLESLTRAASNADASRQKVTSLKLAKALVLTVWQQVAITALYALVYNLASYVGPYLINDLVQYLNGDKRFGNKQGYLLVLGFVGAKALESLSQRHWYFRVQQAGIRLSPALASVVYEKGLTLSSKSRQSRTSGEMINIISVDANRVGTFSWCLHSLWLVPVQVGLALFILYSNLGLASLAALAAMVVVMLVNVPPGQMQQKYQKKLMESKDVRMKATAEILQNMRVLKLQAWEMKFLDKVVELRKTETNWLRKYLYTGALLTFVFWGAPTFVAAVTFGTCVLVGIPLDTGKVLSALATFRVLQGPIYALPGTISMVVQTKVSLDRIASFLCLEEMATDAVQKLTSGSSELAIEVCNGSFAWDLEASPVQAPTLKDLHFQARHGMRVAVCGTVGSGKSSLLCCILGEIPKLSGEVKTCGTMAYVSQSAWIQSGTIQENILFGKEMDVEMYDRVLEACSLRKDLEILPFGDQTVVGERGINLSGGQKQRIQIARALYQAADIYLFDDPFSAVDAHTGSHLFKECLLGLLASKTVVYVTHQIEFLPAADLILVIKDGRIVQSGKYNEILSAGEELMELVGAHKDALTALDSIHVTNRSNEASSSNGTVRVASPLSSIGAEKKENQNDREDGGSAHKIGQLVEEEERDKGRVGFRVYWKYLTLAYGGVLAPLVLLVHILFQVFQIASNYWMAWAAPMSDDAEPPVSMSMLIDVYVALALASSFCVLVRTMLLVTAAYKTATLLFNKMHKCIFRAPMSFFDSTPSGRILNRASADQSKVDTSIAHQMGNIAFSVVRLVGVIVVMSQVAWQVFIVFIPVFAACFWYQQYYIATARELQRIQGVCRAPTLQHFSESITGSSTIRSFGKVEQFVSTNSHLLDTFFRPYFYSVAAMEWLCLHLDVFSSLIFAFSVIFLMNLPSGLIDPAIASLAITYGLDLNTLQATVFWHICELENNIISVERIWQYIGIPSEPSLSMSSDKLDHHWPSKGEIELHNLHVKYAPQLPFVLKGLTCTFPGGTKNGIVGRTGSGKSTLIQTLFRIIDPTVGRMLIDGIDICTIGLHDLRSSLSIIPQDPTMFEGNIRSNLDPLAEYTDKQIWEALDCCQLGDEVRKKEMKLDSPVIENGENWSVGQRQLLCLGRVILKRSKILVLDEATASVDTATDSLIQKTLRQQFSEATVITIAHRITSVLGSDMVLLIDNGVVVEHDMPGKLLEEKSSLFAKLVSEYMMRSIHM